MLCDDQREAGCILLEYCFCLFHYTYTSKNDFFIRQLLQETRRFLPSVDLNSLLMPPWLLIWLARWTSGERFRKATSQDYRFHFGGFFFVGLFMAVGAALGPFLEHASAKSIWLYATIAMASFFFGLRVWAKSVPAVVSLVLGLITYGIFALLVWRRSGVL